MIINEVCEIGRAGTNPESRYFESGKRRVKFRMVVDNPRDKEKAYWFNVECWDKLADTASRYITTGKELGVSGELRYETWVDRRTEKTCHGYVIVARELKLLGGKPSSSYDDEF